MTWSKLCSQSLRNNAFPLLKLRPLILHAPKIRKIHLNRVSFVSVPFNPLRLTRRPKLNGFFYFFACASFAVLYLIKWRIVSLAVDRAEERMMKAPKKYYVCDIKELTQETAEKWKELLETGKDSDFQLIVNGEVFHLHKGILALRSTYFQDLFEKNTLMKTLFPIKRLEKNDFSVEAMKKMVNYIYTMEPIEMDEDAPEVGRIAEDFNLLSEMRSRLTEMETTEENAFSLTYLKGLLLPNNLMCADCFWSSVRFIVDNFDKMEEKLEALEGRVPRTASSILCSLFLYHRLNIEERTLKGSKEKAKCS